MRRSVLFALVSALLTSTLAAAETACLPAGIFKTSEPNPPRFLLGVVNDQPTICAESDKGVPQFGCWAVDAKSGVLSPTSAAWLPGQSRWLRLDAVDCVEGFCTGLERAAEDEKRVLFARSTDERHVAILSLDHLLVFDAKTKALTSSISIYHSDGDPDRPTSVGNMPIRLVYIGDTIHVVGTDAGPFKGVTLFREDGTALGRILHDAGSGIDSMNVYGGTVNQIDARHIALADSGTRSMLILDLENGKRSLLKRAVGSGPCSKRHMLDVRLGDVYSLPRACKQFVQANYEPYFDISPIRLPSGDFLTLLGGPAFGSLAVLDGRTLVEKKRTKLRRCS